jgi:phosphoserine aminotransferase
MGRVHNFSAGPAALPEPVLEEARHELLDWRGRGLSVMEMSHRGEAFAEIAAAAEADFRTLLGLGDDYAVLFVQGGATTQFAAVPLNLLGDAPAADYVVTGAWSKKAVAEAAHLTNARVAATSEADHFRSIPPRSAWRLGADAAYVHLTPNETIGGVEFHALPDVGEVPLVGDVSSTILSRPLPVDRYGCFYAGAQKNMGPAGVTVVVVRRDLLGRARPETPMALDYTKQAKAGSMLNTPPCWAWYVCGLVFRHLLEGGGLEAMGLINRRKAEKLYAYLDGSEFYANPVDPAARSWMNVPFLLARDDVDRTFLAEAEAAGLHGLKGHRSVGGMRASLYNATPETAVDALIEFLQAFAARHA